MHRNVSPSLVVLAALLAPALVACGDAAGLTDSGPAAPAVSAAHGRSASADVNRQLAALRQATAHFHNFEKAVAAGYAVQLTGCMSDPVLGAQGFHYAKPSLIDGTAELLQPELLMYEPRADGSLRLVGVEYIIPLSAWQGSAPPSLLGQEFHVNATFGIWALHVWVGRHNPAGMFADWNPMVSCS